MKKALALCTLAFYSSFLSGCGNLYKSFICGDNKEAIQWYDNGYNPLHIYACGPNALHDLFHGFDECVDMEEISKEILENRNNFYKSLISIASFFNIEAMQITFPNEIKETLKRHGYNFKRITGSREELLDNLYKMELLDEKGIVRLKNPKSITQHWEKFPKEDLFSSFEENSIIVEIYEAIK